MKTIITTFFVIITIALYAEGGKEAKSSFGKNFLPIWEVSTNNALDVAKAMPEDLYNYKPNDSSKTFAEQLVHIATSTEGLMKRFVTGEGGGSNPNASEMSKAEIIELMQNSFAAATDVVAGMTEEQANETIKVFGGKEVTRYIAVMFVQDHLANHRAKANLYIRINDIVPPRYSFF
ncbi:MAG: DinB family protein [Bacteroidota bacterium]